MLHDGSLVKEKYQTIFSTPDICESETCKKLIKSVFAHTMMAEIIVYFVYKFNETVALFNQNTEIQGGLLTHFNFFHVLHSDNSRGNMLH